MANREVLGVTTKRQAKGRTKRWTSGLVVGLTVLVVATLLAWLPAARPAAALSCSGATVTLHLGGGQDVGTTPVAVPKRRTTSAYFANTDTGTGQYPGLLKSVVDPQNGSAATLSTYDVDGQLASQTMPGGSYTRYAHSWDASFQRIDKTFTPSPVGTSGTEAESDTSYLKNGAVRSQTEPYGSGLTAATTLYAYYDNGLLAVVANPLTAPNNWVVYGYDSRGNRTTRSFNAQNSPTDAAHLSSESWTWNLADQELSHQDPSGAATTNVYYTNTEIGAGQVPGQIKTVTQPSGRVETRTYWDSGQPKASVFHLAGQPDVTVSSWWSGTGQRLRTQAPSTGAGQVNTDYRYDAAGRLISMVSPDSVFGSVTTGWQWALAGAKIEVDDGLMGAKEQVVHDPLGRTTGVNIWQGSAFVPLASYGYDGNDDLTSEAVAGSGTRAWSYPVNHSTKPSRYQQSFTSPAVSTDTSLTWRADGRIARDTTVGGPDRRYTYDVAGQLTCRSQGTASCPASVPAVCAGGGPDLYLYAYDPRGARLCQSAGGTVTTYGYDATNTGELVTSTTGSTVTSYGWDSDGRRTSAGSTMTVSYDARGFPATVVTPAGTENRRYDGEGRLVHTDIAGVGGDTVWDPTSAVAEPLSGHDTTGYIQGNYFSGPDRVAGVADVGTITYTYDWRGDNIGNSTNAAPTDYDPYGTPIGGAGPDPWQWNGQYGFDAESIRTDGLSVGVRDYDTRTGTFTSRDPLDGVDGATDVANPYPYAHNDPANQTDPTGMRPSDRQLAQLGTGVAERTAAEGAAEAAAGGDAGIEFASEPVAEGFCAANPEICVAVVVVVVGGVLIYLAITHRGHATEPAPGSSSTTTGSPPTATGPCGSGIDPTRCGQPVTSYRGVSGNLGCKSGLSLGPSAFRVDSDGVSTFERPFQRSDKPCLVPFTFEVPSDSPGAVGPVTSLGGCTATSTPQFGKGHWSIQCTGDTQSILSMYAKARRDAGEIQENELYH